MLGKLSGTLLNPLSSEMVNKIREIAIRTDMRKKYRNDQQNPKLALSKDQYKFINIYSYRPLKKAR